MSDSLKRILTQLVNDFKDEELRDAIVQAAADALPLPNMIEERILVLLWSYAANRLESLLDDA